MMTLFQREGCPYCQPVRQLLTDLNVSYINMNVVKPREERHELIAQTGSKFIPALLDGDVVIPGKLEDNQDIIAYIREKYRQPVTPS